MRRNLKSFASRSKTGTALALFLTFVLVGMTSLAVKGRANGGGGGGGGVPVCQTRISGNGNEGTRDTQVDFSTDNGVTWQDAFVVAPNQDQPAFTYDVIPGTHYVSVTADRSDPKPGGGVPGEFGTFFDTDYLFRTQFTMAGGFTNPTVSVEVNSDNTTAVSLNGNLIGSQNFGEDAAHFKNPTDVIASTNAAFFVVGTNTLTFKVHNFHNQIALDFKATICTTANGGCVDQNPPSVSCSVAYSELWPPNHDLENVGFTAQITDDCSCFNDSGNGDDDDDDDGHHGHGATVKPNNGGGGGDNDDDDDDDGDHGDCDNHGDDDDDDDGHHGHGAVSSNTNSGSSSGTVSVKVYSDEPDLDIPGSGNFSPDAKNIGLGTLRLREERSGTGDGRVYLIVVKATDASGKVGYCAKTVTVPHSQSNSARNAVRAAATAARTYFLANKVPPPGYVEVGTGPVRGSKQ